MGQNYLRESSVSKRSMNLIRFIITNSKLSLISSLLFFAINTANAAVTITAPSLNIGTCTVYPTSYRPLGNIVFTEGANGDFAVGTNVTLVFTAPANFEFLAGTGSVTVGASANLSNESITVTATTITVSYTSGGTNKTDVMTISGIQVRGITGSATQSVTRTGGTGTVNGLANGAVVASLTSTNVSSPSGGTATSSASNPMCNNTPTTLSAVGGTDGTAFQWQSSTDNVTFTNIAGATSATYVYTPTAVSTMYFKRIVTCGTTATSTSVQVTSQVCDCTTGCTATSVSVDLSASTDTTYSIGTVTRNGLCCLQTGTKCIRFDIQVNPGSDLINFQVANPAPPGGATYQIDCGAPTSLGTPACISGGSHCIVFCKSGNDSPTYTIIATRTIHGSNDITVRAGCAGAISVTGLQTSSISWTSIYPGASGAYNSYLSCLSGCASTNVTPAAGAPAYIDYMVTGSPNTSCPGTSRDTIRVNIVPAMTVAISPTTPVICSGGPGSVSLTATATGGAPPYTYSWSPGGATTQTISATAAGTYTVSVSDGTGACPAITATVTVAANPTPSAPTAAGASICTGTSATLTATAPGGTYSWYSAATGGTLLATAASYTTPVLTATTTYYVETNVGGCTGPRTAVTVSVNPVPAAPTASGTTICQGSTATLTATAPGGTYDWYTASTGGILLSTGASYTTPSLSANTTYYVQSTINGCAGPRTAVTVTVTPTPAAPTAAGSTICEGQTATLTATAPGGTYSWYDAVSGGTLLFTGASYTTPVLTATTSYYVQTSVSGCPGPRTTVTVTVTPIPAAPTAAGTTICQGSTATLSATAPGGTYDWFSVSTGGSSLFTGASFTTPALSANTTYYVQSTVSGCAGPRTAVTVTVTPTPAAPTAAGTTICTGTTATLTATAPGGTYGWYDASSGGTLLASTASYTTPVLTSTTTYYVQTTVSGCAGPRTSVTVTVSPVPAAPTASGATICSGGTATLTATAPGGTYSWYTASTGGTLLATTASYTTPVLTTTTTYYVQTTVAGCAGPRTAVSVTVNPIPAAPTASGATICQGTSTTLTATAPGGTYSWYDAASGGTLLATSASYTTPNLSATTSYYVETTVGGCTGPRTTVTVTITPTPAAPTAAGATICQGTSTTLTATAPGGTYQWYDAASGGTLLASGAGYTTPSLTTTTSYYVQTTVNGCTGPRTTVTVTVTPTPAAPTAAGVTICQSTSTTLTATAPGGTYEWYDAASGGTLLATAASYTTPVLSATTTYYVQTTISGCAGPRTAVTVTVTPTPAAPTAAGTTICSGSTATVTATAPGGTYDWYSASTGGTLLSTGASFTTPVLTATTTYYVQTTISGCAGPRTAVTVTVNPIPAAPTAANKTICVGTSAILTATAPGGSYQWYDAASGGTLLASTASYTTPVLNSTTTFYVQTTIGGCTGPRTAVTVTTSPVPAAPTASGAAICTGSTATLTATAPGGTYQWYSAATGGTLLATAASYTTPVLSATTTYYVQTTVAGCAGPRTAVTVTVSPIPAAPTAAGATICSGNTATLTATAPGGTYDWYDASTGGTLLATTSSFTTPSLTTSTTYYVSSTISGCTGPRTAVTVTVNPIPSAPTAAGATICQGTSTTLTATAAGGSYQWYDAASGGTLLASGAGYTTPSLTTTTSYYVQTTVNGCIGPRTTVTVIVTPTPAAPTAAGVTICQSTSTTLTATAPGGTYEWYDAASGGTLLATAASYTTSVLSVTTTYYVQTTISGCAGPRTAVTVTVTPTPAAPTAAGTTICSGSTATVTATAPGGTYDWYSASTGGTLLSTGASFTTPVLTATTTYYVQTTISGCAGPRTAVTVTVNPIPAAPTAANITICDGSTGTVTATAPGGSYQWYDAASGGTLLASTASYTTPVLNSTTVYYVQTTIGGCTGPRTAVTVAVNPIPSAPAANGATICQGTSTILSATVPGGTYRWYPVPTGGTLLFTGANYTTPVLNVTTTYYVQTTVGGCNSPRTAVTVTVTPTPAAPTASGTTICEGTSATLTATAPGGSYEWYDASTGGNLLTSGSNYSTPSLIATTTYYVQTTISGCTGPRTAVTVTVTPTEISAFNYSSGTYCITGTNPTPSTTGSAAGTFSATPAGLVFTNSTTGTINLSASALNTYVVTYTTIGSCPSSTSANITVTNAPSAVFSYNSPNCQNDANQLPIFASGASAGIFSATPAGLIFVSTSTGEVDLAASTPGTYTVTNNIAAAGGCAAATASSSITINLSPQVNAGADQTICESTTASITGIIGGSATSLVWSGGSGTFSSTTTASTVYTPGAGETTAILVLTTNDPAGPCTAVADTVLINITPSPAAPTAAGTTICEGTTASLSATAPGGTYQWYDAATGGTLLTTGALYTTPVLTTTTTYYVQTTVSGCPGPRTPVTVTVTPTPDAPTAAGTSICMGSSAVLTATAPGGTYEWYDASTGGTLLSSSSSFTTPMLTSTTSYYVQSTISGCTGPRTTVTVTVNPIPPAPTASNITICDGSSGTITATAPGGNYEWYDAATGGNLLATTASYTTPVLTSATIYYVQTTIAGCTGPRKAVTVNVNPIPSAPTAAGITICQGTNAILSATAPGGTYRWYPVATGGTLLFTGANYSTPVLNATTTYYVQTTLGGCTSPRTAVTVTVTPTPAAPTVANTMICSGNTATLTATAPGGNYEWYSAITGGTLLTSGASFTTPVLTSTTSYYVQTTISGCSSTRTTVSVTVTPIDDPSFSYSSGTYCFTGVNPTPVVTGTSGTFSATPAGLVFVSTTTGEINLGASALNTYAVTYTTNGVCTSNSTVNVTITNAPSAVFTYNTPYCQSGNNPVPSFGAGASAGVFTASPSGLVFVDASTGEVNLLNTIPGTYTITNNIAAAGGCAAASASSSLTIDPSATVNAGPNIIVCGSGTASLNGTIGGTATSAIWSGGTGSFANSSSLSTIYTPGPGETTAMLILTTNDPAGPCSAVKDTLIVNINPIPVAPTAADVTICQGTTATLTATAPGGTYQWYAVATGGTALGTGANFTTPVLNASTTYYVQTTNGGCTSPRTPVMVNVTPTDNSSFSYSSGTFCITGANPSPTTAAGVTGTFSASPSGLVFIDAATGEINLAASTLNTYVITFTTSGACPSSSTVNVTITTAPDATFSYNGPYCPSGANPLPTFPSGASAGIFSASPAGLNFVNASTGEINLSTSVPGTYTVTNDIAAGGGCAAATANSTVTIDQAPTVNAGADQIVCSGSSVALSGIIGGSATGGTWTGGAGAFSNNTDLNAVYTPVSGETSATLTLTTNDPAGSCNAISDNMVITFQSDTSSFTYSSGTYCLSGINPVPVITGGYTGTFSASPAGLVFVSTSTGEIDLSASAINNYTISFTSNGTCPNTTSVSLALTNGLDASFSYSGPYCQSGSNPVVTLGAGANAGVFSSSPSGLNFVNTSTGEIDLLTTVPGSYTVTNFIAASGGCAAVSATATVTVDSAAIVNAGSDRTVCDGSTVSLAGSISGAATSAMWTGGTGIFSDASLPNAVYTPGPGETSAMLILTSNDPSGPCGSKSDTMTITINPIPVAPAVNDTTICYGESATLIATAPGGTYQWFDAPTGGTLLGTGSPFTSAVIFTMTNFYVQTTIGGCTSPQTMVTVNVNPAPVVLAGADQTVCGNNASIILSGSVSNAPGGTWTSTGSGSFSPNDSALNATYTPSSAEISSGSVILMLTSNGNCAPVTDSIVITFSPSPIVNAGADQFICTGTMTVNLNGSVSGGASTGQWTTLGSGTFTPNDTMLNAVYTMSTADTTAGVVTLVLTSTNNGTCLQVTDTMQVSITTIPTTAAGYDTTVCGNNPVVQLNGNVTGGSGVGFWSSNGTGTFAPSDSVLNAVYSPGAADIASGSVILTLTPYNTCMPVSDSLMLMITPPTVVNAGNDVTVCSSVPNVLLNGSVTGTSVTGTWTTNGDGVFSASADSLNATYTFGSADTASGSVMLILTSTNNGICNAISDTMMITITNTTVALAGNDIIVCANNAVANLNGSLQGGSSANWSSSGTGIFTPSDSVLNASYQPSFSDIATGTVLLTLTPLNSCNPTADSLILTITPAPVVNAGTDVTVCGLAGISLVGTIDTVADGAFWSTNGTGSFMPNDSALNATYIPGVADNDTVSVILTTYGNGLCNAVSDTMFIFRTVQPTASFTSVNRCLNQSVLFTDNSNSNGGTITSWSWTFGSGGNTSNLQNPSFAYPAAGSYTVSLVVSSGSGCADSVSQTITINPSPVASYTALTGCQNTAFTFTDASSISSGSIVSWNWNFADGNTSSLQNPTNMFNSAGVYSPILIVTSDSGCTSQFSIPVTVNPSPLAGFTSATDCKSMNVVFTDTSSIASGNISSFSWTFGDGGVSSSQNPNYIYAATGSYDVMLIVQSNNGCADTANVSVSPGSPVVAEYMPHGGSYNVSEIISFDNQSTGASSFVWNFQDGSGTSTDSDPSHSFSVPGTYAVELTASNASGCSDTVSYDFVITSAGTAVPNGFTPNDDGLNDYFYVIGNFSSYELRVFNEWGNQIFISTDQSNKWDGSYKGKEQPAGTYIYIFNGKVIDGTELKMNGEVNLIR